jgi:hypothetical protein
VLEQPTERTRRVAVVPPTALAFEHTAVLAEDVPSEDELTDPGRSLADGARIITPTPLQRPIELTKRKHTKTVDKQPSGGQRRSFGVHFDAHEPLIERSLVHEIDPTSDEESGPEYLTHPHNGGRPSFAAIGIGVFLAAVGLGFLGVWLWASF